MSRGGRRRRGRRGRTRPASPEPRHLAEGAPEEPAPARSLRRVPPGQEPAAQESVLERMNARPARLSTLPPDGTVLEDLIGDLRREYGVPATPQEYRLVIKTRMPDEAGDAGDLEDSEADEAILRARRRRSRTISAEAGSGGSPAGPRATARRHSPS